MSTTRAHTLTFAEFHAQLWDCRIGIVEQSLGAPIQQVVIRGLDGDYCLAACHREWDTLVLDLGQPIP
jgi:hypothetical protein